MDAPPSYEATVTGSSSTNQPNTSTTQHESRNGIPPQKRRSMEDELRPLPEGWLRQYDPETHHQFFIDTNASPPRSIWSHPYDDEQYLSTLSPAEREKVTRLHRSVSLADIEAESSDDDTHHPHQQQQQQQHQELPPRKSPNDASDANPTGIYKFGRRMKDKLTHSTHAERERARQQRAEQERRAYEAHLRARDAMARALRTGEPQFLGKDTDGRDVYIEPPNGPALPRGAYGYNPYAQGGAYANPNARFVRPAQPYERPYGYGYGGGYGFPIAGALLGGALLGGLLF
jgi:hypothetical protein